MNMIFSTKQQNYSQYNQLQNQNQIQNQNTMLLRMNRVVRYAPNTSTNTQVIENNIDEQLPKKMKWGEPTWFLFHTMAHKVKDEHFDDMKLSILTIITSICNNLPCPNCANHASEYMRRVNYNSIRTKQDLKNLFFQFHNEVNLKKGFPLFPIEQLDEKYSKAVTKNIIQHFMIFFQDKHKSIHMIANDIHRARLSQNFKQWFNENIQNFDL
jgi:hypothetical protein